MASVFVLHRLIIWLNAFPKRLMILTQYLMCCIYLSRSTNHEQRQPLLRGPDTEKLFSRIVSKTLYLRYLIFCFEGFNILKGEGAKYCVADEKTPHSDLSR